MPITTTLNRIRKHSPCKPGWAKLLAYLGKTEADDEPVSYLTILDSNGVEDCLWCARVEPQHDKLWRTIALKFARDVEHLSADPRVKACNDVTERHISGDVTDAELAGAWEDARDAARAAERDAAWAARDAAWAAWAAAWDATDAARDAALGAARAARDAAWAARDAARDAAWAARDAAWVAARGAARDAAWDAAWDAARDARDAVRAVRDAARAARDVARAAASASLDAVTKTQAAYLREVLA